MVKSWIKNLWGKTAHFFGRSIADENVDITKPESTFHLLSDDPLGDEEEVRFGASSIAETLARLIATAPNFFCLGLFGRWGVGKTTILRLLSKKVDGLTKIVEFDAWKYEQDSLRRQFLITMDLELVGGTLKYKSVLNQSLSKVVLGAKISPGETIWRNPLVLQITISLLIVLVLIQHFYGWTGLEHFLEAVGIPSVLFGIILKLGDQTVVETRTDSAEAFEARFFEEVLPQCKGKGWKRIVIIIDNLDRAQKEKAVQLLADIKTFLGQSKIAPPTPQVVFLIACDDKAIADHIHATYGKEFDAQEFLRKFFGAYVRIPKFLDDDLDGYIIEQLQRTQVPELQNNSPLVRVMVSAFRDNPREIKQFINILVSHILLARVRESGKKKDREIIQERLVSGRPDFLAKLLVIRHQYPRTYAVIEEAIQGGESRWSELRSAIGWEIDRYRQEGEAMPDQEEGRYMIQNGDRLRTFFNKTDDIVSDNLVQFVSFRQSDNERQLPEWQPLVLAAQDSEIAIVTKIVRKIKQDQRIKVLDSLLTKHIRQASHSDEYTLIGSLLNASRKTRSELPRFFVQVAIQFPNSNALKDVIGSLEPSLIIDYLCQKDIPSEAITKICMSYSDLLLTASRTTPNSLSDTAVASLLKQVSIHNTIFDTADIIKNIQLATEARFFSTEVLVEPIKKKHFVDNYLTNQGSVNFLGQITKSDLATHRNLCQDILWLHLGGKVSSQVYLTNINRLLQDIRGADIDEKKTTAIPIALSIAKFVANTQTNLPTEFETTLDHLVALYSELSNVPEVKLKMVRSIAIMLSALTPELRNRVVGVLENFFSTEPTGSTMPLLRIPLVGEKVARVLLERIKANVNEYLPEAIGAFDDNQKRNLVEHYIKSGVEFLILKGVIRDIQLAVVSNQKPIIDAILVRSGTIIPSDRKDWYNLIEELGGLVNYPDLLVVMYQQIMTSMQANSKDVYTRKQAYKIIRQYRSYLSDDYVKELQSLL